MKLKFMGGNVEFENLRIKILRITHLKNQNRNFSYKYMKLKVKNLNNILTFLLYLG